MNSRIRFRQHCSPRASSRWAECIAIIAVLAFVVLVTATGNTIDFIGR